MPEIADGRAAKLSSPPARTSTASGCSDPLDGVRAWVRLRGGSCGDYAAGDRREGKKKMTVIT